MPGTNALGITYGCKKFCNTDYCLTASKIGSLSNPAGLTSLVVLNKDPTVWVDGARPSTPTPIRFNCPELA
jgi:hypothetical protein